MESDSLYAASEAPFGSGDPIGNAISLLRPRTTIDPGLRAGGSWAVRFAAFPHVRIGGVVRGGCWLLLDGHEPVRLREGDFYLLSAPPPHLLASAPTPTGEPVAERALREGAEHGVARVGDPAREDNRLCGGAFRFDEANAALLVDLLPRLVHVPAADPRTRLLAHLTELIGSEVEGAVGCPLVQDHLAQVLFVHVLRAHAEQAGAPAGWLGALNDDGIGAVLRALHADVARRWTLAELAGVAHMSRSTFAAAFKAQVGSAPLEYLIQWRMSLARDALRRGTRTISALAAATGYESESAFSTAFRRVVGSSPRQFRDAARRSAAGNAREASASCAVLR